jgi:transposase
MKKRYKFLKKVSNLLKKIGCREFLHHFGPKKYKFKEHATALLLKEVCKLSFRRVVIIFDLFNIKAPSYSALCKCRKRIPLWIWNRLLQVTVQCKAEFIAIDSTGFSRTNPSFYFVKRIDRKKPIKRYTKLSVLYDIINKKIISMRIRAKPRHDINDVYYLLKQNYNLKKLFGDSAYDCEKLHEYCFYNNIQTIIKPRKNVKRGGFRKIQNKNYSEKEYHQRSLVEAGFSSLKRRYGQSVSGKNITSNRAEIFCKAIANNLNLKI